jgi:hypothetical protein
MMSTIFRGLGCVARVGLLDALLIPNCSPASEPKAEGLVAVSSLVPPIPGEVYQSPKNSKRSPIESASNVSAR